MSDTPTQPIERPVAPDDQMAGIWILAAILLGLVVGLGIGGIVGYCIGLSR